MDSLLEFHMHKAKCMRLPTEMWLSKCFKKPHKFMTNIRAVLLMQLEKDDLAGLTITIISRS